MAQELREHFAMGRIDADELSARLEHVYAAKTVAELAEQLADLPDLPHPPAVRRAEIAERRAELRRQVIQQAGGSVGLFGVCVAIWAASGAGGFWPAFVLVGTGIFVGRNLWRLYGPAPELDRVEAELKRRHHAGGRRGGPRSHRSRRRREAAALPGEAGRAHGEPGHPLGPGGHVE